MLCLLHFFQSFELLDNNDIRINIYYHYGTKDPVDVDCVSTFQCRGRNTGDEGTCNTLTAPLSCRHNTQCISENSSNNCKNYYYIRITELIDKIAEKSGESDDREFIHKLNKISEYGGDASKLVDSINQMINNNKMNLPENMNIASLYGNNSIPQRTTISSTDEDQYRIYLDIDRIITKYGYCFAHDLENSEIVGPDQNVPVVPVVVSADVSDPASATEPEKLTTTQLVISYDIFQKELSINMLFSLKQELVSRYHTLVYEKTSRRDLQWMSTVSNNDDNDDNDDELERDLQNLCKGFPELSCDDVMNPIKNPDKLVVGINYPLISYCNSPENNPEDCDPINDWYEKCKSGI